MSTTTIRTCDFCGGVEVRGDRERWGVLHLLDAKRDLCPVCIAKLRAAA